MAEQNQNERGWVATTTDEADGRKTIAQVTDRVKTEGMKRRNRNAQDALAPLLARASPEERASVSVALERFYELAVDARTRRSNRSTWEPPANPEPSAGAKPGEPPDRTSQKDGFTICESTGSVSQLNWLSPVATSWRC